MHLAIIRESFLRRETSSDTEFADAFSELPQDVVHPQSIWEWLPNRLPLVR